MKNLICITFTLITFTQIHAGVGTRGTGIGKRGREYNNVLSLSNHNGISTQGTGINMRNTGIGTRGTSIQKDTHGFGTRGTSDSKPSTANDFLDLQLSEIGAVPFMKVFQKDALVLKVVVSQYLSSKQRSFDTNKSENTFSPMSFEEWATTNAGSLLDQFEDTHWVLVSDSNSNNHISYEFIPESKSIEVISSPEGLQQRIQSGMISNTLAQFFLYAEAPFSYDEIYFEILPFEKDIVNKTKSNF